MSIKNHMRYQGRLTDWNDDKGFGFVTPNGGGMRAFVHVKAFKDRQRRPSGNEILTYEMTVDTAGRPQARNVAFADSGRSSPGAHAALSKAPLAILAAAVLALALAWTTGLVSAALVLFYLVASATAFTAYAIDKSAAKNNRWRTQEITLHFFSLVGGWPGALAAQYLLRHKSKKRSFLIGFWFTVVLHCGALAWLLLSARALELRTLTGVV